MATWSEDSELYATFRAEVEDRLASLTAGLLNLESLQRPRDGVAALFRDAHTVKGSARMMGLGTVVTVAHRAEDLLAALRDGRMSVKRDLVDLLLSACDAIGRAIPGAKDPVTEADLLALVAAFEDVLGAPVGAAAPSASAAAGATTATASSGTPTAPAPARPRPAGGSPAAGGGFAPSPLVVPGSNGNGSGHGAGHGPSNGSSAGNGTGGATATGTGPGNAGASAHAPSGSGAGGSGAGGSGASGSAGGSAAGGAGAGTGGAAGPSPFAAPAFAAAPVVPSPAGPAEIEGEAHAEAPHPAVEPAGAPAPAAAAAPGAAADTLRIPAPKVHDLIDAVGEVELGARRLARAVDQAAALLNDQHRWTASLRTALRATELPDNAELALHRLTATGDQLSGATASLRELAEDHGDRVALVRDSALGLAMVPLRRVVAGYSVLVRELSRRLGTQVELVLTGQDVELDKQVLDAVADSLRHLVTNAVDHGCGTPEQRREAGRPEVATVTVAARSAGGTVVIEVSDDGLGIDEEAVRTLAIRRGILPADSTLSGAPLLNVLFTPAFSTRSSVTETSGRGVGLDAVRAAVESLGGSVAVRTERFVGTTFTVTLPVTLAVLSCLVARVGDERYAIPVSAVTETISLRDVEVHQVGGAPVVVREGVSLPLLDLAPALGVSTTPDREARAAVVARHGSRSLAWAVDRLEGEAEMVVKDLGSFLRGRVPGVVGATIDGDGAVVCLLDLREVGGRTIDATAFQLTGKPEAAVAPARVLVVEDSVGVRELERAVLEGAGYEVETCIDGLEGAARLSGEPTDLVLSDVEMPGMDGYTLTRTLRRTQGWERVPVIIMTSRGSEDDQRMGLEAGADAYLLKGEFDQDQLVETARRLIGR